jgi:hypothetical protein
MNAGFVISNIFAVFGDVFVLFIIVFPDAAVAFGVIFLKFRKLAVKAAAGHVQLCDGLRQIDNRFNKDCNTPDQGDHNGYDCPFHDSIPFQHYLISKLQKFVTQLKSPGTWRPGQKTGVAMARAYFIDV